MLNRLIAATVVVITLSVSAQCDPYVTGLYEPVDGGYRLYFTLHNTLAYGELYHFAVGTDDAHEIASPLGWTVLQTYTAVKWYAESYAYELPPGESLGGFEYTAQVEPHAVMSWSTWTHTDKYYGEVTPTFIPEPSSLLALAGGLAAFGIPFARRRKRYSMLQPGHNLRR